MYLPLKVDSRCLDGKPPPQTSEHERVERVGVSVGAGEGVGSILGVLSLKQEQLEVV